MTEQHALWNDPHWSDAWSIGDRVSSSFTGNTGVIVGKEPGRHLLVEWSASDRWSEYVVRHSSPLGLVKETA